VADLVVSRAVLEDSSQKLAKIKEEFDNSGSRVEGHSEIWGQKDLAGAMNSFVNNWKIHRGHISKAVGDLKKKIDDSSVAWDDTEKQLSEALTTETTETG